jgi:2-polyprenyl-3-methyl-5-hydroxy-6-metoxy-1,4-benzoquinol methylase
MTLHRVPCPICGGTLTTTLYTKFDHDIGRCRGCGLVYANPRAEDAIILGRYGADYFQKEYLPALGVVDGRYELEQFDRRYAPLLDLLEPAPGRRLLEIGCGAGFFMKAAERRGWRAVGIEFSEEATRFAREKLGLDVRRARGEDLAAAAGGFDAAVMFDSIEHLFEPAAVLERISQSLVPGGLLLITTPNFRALSRRVIGAQWAVLNPLEHLFYFEEDTLGRLLRAAGFTSVRFIRKHPGWGPQETMNCAYTHAPDRLRVRAAASAVRLGGRGLARVLQSLGRQDVLLAAAQRD